MNDPQMNEPETRPCRRGDISFEEVDGEAVVYDRLMERATYLSESAVAIWHLCNGSFTAAEITALLVQALEEPEAAIARDVGDAINAFRQAGLLR